MIKRIEKKDFLKAKELIERNFPYTSAEKVKLRERAKNKNVFLFKAEENGEMEGMIDFELRGGSAIINGLVVKEGNRGRGIGTALLDFALKEIKKRKANEVRLIVQEDNTTAKKLYKKFGFEKRREFFGEKIKKEIEEMVLEIGKENYKEKRILEIGKENYKEKTVLGIEEKNGEITPKVS